MNQKMSPPNEELRLGLTTPTLKRGLCTLKRAIKKPYILKRAFEEPYTL